MSLTVTQSGPNPQVPGIASELFVPDQLIAGNAKLITDSVTLTGAMAYTRGMVVGQINEGAVTSTSGVQGTGTLTIASLPAAAATITVNGTVITFVAANPVGNQCIISTVGVADQADLLQAFLATSTDANLVKMTYTVAGAVVTLTAIAAGTAGNYALVVASSGGAVTRSGANMTGGAANTGNATISLVTLGATAKQGQYVATCLTATTAQVVDPSGNEIGVATFGTAFTDNQINFTITAGGTPCIAGDAFIFYVVKGSSSYTLAVASATDGSQVPAAIVVDSADATNGDVTGGVYLAGEFNGAALVLGPGITLAAVKAAGRTRGMFIKTSVTALPPS